MGGVRDDLPEGDEPRGGIFDEGDPEGAPLEDPGDEHGPGQRGMETDWSQYFEPGYVQMAPGPDGMPQLAGAENTSEAQEGLTDENLVCTGGKNRPPCRYYTAVLVPAPGDAKGFAKLRHIRRFCRLLATASELFEITEDIYACTSRDPQDEKSVAKIHEFEEKQKQIAQENAETSGELDF